jgi:murein DD-endopeptidase MepM/ murein hydrolase activator NlpD
MVDLNSIRDIWLPFPAGVSAFCAQGPLSNATHQGQYAWDFILPVRSPIVSARCGRVFFIADDSSATGSHSPSWANMIFVDLGGGRFASYVHHRTGTARVKLGDLVGVGTQLAEVGSSGTTSPHLHFDIRGGDWKTSHNVRFSGHKNALIEVMEGQNHLSVTEESEPVEEESFVDSVLDGREFLANGVQLQPGLPAYVFRAGSEVVFRGTLLKQEKYVFFQLWRRGSKPSALSSYACAEQNGGFVLRLQIPGKLSGSYWYMLSCRNRYGATQIPVWVC